jgi:8-oxo-dGTP pyrophosphatase MutT (NUDIX family)
MISSGRFVCSRLLMRGPLGRAKEGLRMSMSPYIRRLRGALGSELLVLPSVTGIVFDDRGRILLVRQAASGVWSAPGGSVDPDETPADAVVREVWEETGLYTAPVRILGVYGGPLCLVTYPNGDRSEYVMTVFECEVRGGVLRATSDETTDAGFVAAGDLSGYRTSTWVQHILPGLYDRSRFGHFDPPVWRPPRS